MTETIKDKIIKIKRNRMNFFEKSICYLYENYTIKISVSTNLESFFLNKKIIMMISGENKKIYVSFYNLYTEIVSQNLVEKTIVRKETEKYIHKYFGYNDYEIVDVLI